MVDASMMSAVKYRYLTADLFNNYFILVTLDPIDFNDLSMTSYVLKVLNKILFET